MSAFLNVFFGNRSRVQKGWGHEDWVIGCGKVLFIEHGKKTSWHYHPKKEETLYVQSGVLLVRFLTAEEVEQRSASGWEEEDMVNDPICNKETLYSGNSFRVPVGMRHQLEARGDVTLVEFSPHDMDEASVRIVKGD